MNQYLLGFLCLLVIDICACSRGRMDNVVIRWDASNKYEEIHWYIDGNFVGVSEVGYNKVYETLSALSDRALVKVAYPFELWNPSVEGYSAESIFPVPDDHPMKSKMMSIFEAKKISIPSILC